MIDGGVGPQPQRTHNFERGLRLFIERSAFFAEEDKRAEARG